MATEYIRNLPFTVLGYREDGRPIFNIAGGAENDADDDIEVPDDDTDLKEPDELKDPPEYVAPSKEEWERTTAALKKANNQARKLRQEKRAAQESGDKPNDTDIEKVKQDAVRETEGRWKPKLIASAAKAALVSSGLQGSPDRLLKMIDTDEIEIDDDGEVLGLDDQITTLKTDYPELFGKPKVPKADGGRRTPAGDGKKKSSAEIIAERFNAG